jgi:DNA polymerase III alpha subunit
MLTNNTIEELTEGVLRHGPEILEKCLADHSELQKYFSKLSSEHLQYPTPKSSIDIDNWSIPREYQEMDIGAWVREQTPPWDPEHTRVEQELALFEKHGMTPVLKAMKYIVDTLRANNVVWGVGRGSSVASYVLHIIGVHKINSVKYNIPIEEFFKGDQNG